VARPKAAIREKFHATPVSSLRISLANSGRSVFAGGDQRAFELGKTAEYREHETPMRRRGIGPCT
jgi:hypothetical protein